MATSPLINSLIGGLLIGSAASLLLWLNGRIAGISSIIVNLLFSKTRTWPTLFAIGIIGGAFIFYAIGGQVPSARPNFPAGLLALAGVLIGFGTSLSHGCTSGHGVCGLGRLSLRSLVATVTFLIAGIVTTFVVRHLFGVL
jgi:uncharacterized membrane protein YedE/YeeE